MTDNMPSGRPDSSPSSEVSRRRGRHSSAAPPGWRTLTSDSSQRNLAVPEEDYPTAPLLRVALSPRSRQNGSARSGTLSIVPPIAPERDEPTAAPASWQERNGQGSVEARDRSGALPALPALNGKTTAPPNDRPIFRTNGRAVPEENGQATPAPNGRSIKITIPVKEETRAPGSAPAETPAESADSDSPPSISMSAALSGSISTLPASIPLPVVAPVVTSAPISIPLPTASPEQKSSPISVPIPVVTPLIAPPVPPASVTPARKPAEEAGSTVPIARNPKAPSKPAEASPKPAEKSRTAASPQRPIGKDGRKEAAPAVEPAETQKKPAEPQKKSAEPAADDEPGKDHKPLTTSRSALRSSIPPMSAPSASWFGDPRFAPGAPRRPSVPGRTRPSPKNPENELDTRELAIRRAPDRSKSPVPPLPLHETEEKPAAKKDAPETPRPPERRVLQPQKEQDEPVKQTLTDKQTAGDKPTELQAGDTQPTRVGTRAAARAAARAAELAAKAALDDSPLGTDITTPSRLKIPARRPAHAKKIEETLPETQQKSAAPTKSDKPSAKAEEKAAKKAEPVAGTTQPVVQSDAAATKAAKPPQKPELKPEAAVPPAEQPKPTPVPPAPEQSVPTPAEPPAQAVSSVEAPAEVSEKDTKDEPPTKSTKPEEKSTAAPSQIAVPRTPRHAAPSKTEPSAQQASTRAAIRAAARAAEEAAKPPLDPPQGERQSRDTSVSDSPSSPVSTPPPASPSAKSPAAAEPPTSAEPPTATESPAAQTSPAVKDAPKTPSKVETAPTEIAKKMTDDKKKSVPERREQEDDAPSPQSAEPRKEPSLRKTPPAGAPTVQQPAKTQRPERPKAAAPAAEKSELKSQVPAKKNEPDTSPLRVIADPKADKSAPQPTRAAKRAAARAAALAATSVEPAAPSSEEQDKPSPEKLSVEKPAATEQPAVTKKPAVVEKPAATRAPQKAPEKKAPAEQPPKPGQVDPDLTILNPKVVLPEIPPRESPGRTAEKDARAASQREDDTFQEPSALKGEPPFQTGSPFRTSSPFQTGPFRPDEPPRSESSFRTSSPFQTGPFRPDPPSRDESTFRSGAPFQGESPFRTSSPFQTGPFRPDPPSRDEPPFREEPPARNEPPFQTGSPFRTSSPFQTGPFRPGTPAGTEAPFQTGPFRPGPPAHEEDLFRNEPALPRETYFRSESPYRVDESVSLESPPLVPFRTEDPFRPKAPPLEKTPDPQAEAVVRPHSAESLRQSERPDLPPWPDEPFENAPPSAEKEALLEAPADAANLPAAYPPVTVQVLEARADELERRRLGTRHGWPWWRKLWHRFSLLLSADDTPMRLAASIEETQVELQTGLRVGVIGAEGGVGVTTVAALIAHCFVRARQDSVSVVASADDRGALATALGSETHCFASHALESAISPQDLVDNLAYSPDGAVTAVTAVDIDDSHLRKLVNRLTYCHTLTVLDMGRDTRHHLLDQCHVMVLVASPSVPGMLAAKQALRELDSLGVPVERVVVLVVDTGRDTGITPARAISAITGGHRPGRVIPCDRHLGGATRIDLAHLAEPTSVASAELVALLTGIAADSS
ncbi:hypothetical protein [Austwickia chelonae]|uniref:hypothetical protein n=1 Tax=Austwickia chelonae TaxID=100225 RepID=UPI001F0821AF|nr:hypothetical protein [Austwickia chelonae]